jgi:hypothetical protein
MRRRTAASVALAVVVACTGSSCGASQEDRYCQALRADQELFAAMQDDTSGLALLKHRDALHRLADQAPDDLTDEWQTLLGAVDAFAQTLTEVGVKPEDFVDGQAPAGLDPTKRTRIANAASELSSQDVVEAANGIEQQARDVCKLQLGL